MAQAGLTDGLNPQNLTMRDRANIVGHLRSRGASDEEIFAALGISPAAQVPEAGIGDEKRTSIGENFARGLQQNFLVEPLFGYGQALNVPEIEGYQDDVMRVLGSGLTGLSEFASTDGYEDWQGRFAEDLQNADFLGKVGLLMQSEGSDAAVGIGGTYLTGGAATPVLAAQNYGNAVAEAVNTQIQEEFGGDEAAYNEARKNDPALYGRMQMAAGITTALDSISDKLPVFKGPGKELLKPVATKAFMKALKKTGGEFTKQAIVEATTEILQTAQNVTINDPEVRQAFMSGDLEGAYNTLIEKHGEELALSAAVGGSIGGAAGGAVGASKAVSEPKKQEAREARLLEIAKEHGITEEQLTEIIGDDAQRKEFAQGLASVEQEEDNAQRMERQALNVEQDSGATPAQKREARAAADTARENTTKVRDAVFTKFGGLSIADINARAENKRREQAADAARTFKAFNIQPEKEVDVETSKRIADLLNQTDDRLARAEQRLETSKAGRNAEKIAEARQEVIEARAEKNEALKQAYKTVGDKTGRQAQKAVKRNQAVQAHEEREFGTRAQQEADPEAVIKRADEVIADEQKRAKKSATGNQKKLEKLQERLPDLEDPDEIVKVQEQIEALQAKALPTSPLGEAAVRAKRNALARLGRAGEELSPPAEALPSGDASPETGPQAGQAAAAPSAGVAPDVGGAAAAEIDVDMERSVRADAAERLAAKEGQIARDTEALAALEIEGGDKAEVTKRRQRLKKNEQDAKALREDIRKADENIAAAEAEPAPKVEPRPDLDHNDGPSMPGYAYQSLAGDVASDDDLRQWTKDSGYEAAALIDADGNFITAGTNNNANIVGMPRAGRDQAAEMTHTHPANTPMSLADLRVATSLGLPFSALLPNGQKLQITPVDGTTEDQINALEVEVNEAGGDIIRPALGPTARARVLQEAGMQVADARGLVEYTRPMEGFTDAERNEIDAIVDRLLGDGNRLQPAAVDGGTETGPSGRPDGEVPAGIAPETEVAAARDPVNPEFTEAFKAGATNEELIQRPEFKAAVGEMMTLPSTAKQPGFWSPEWQRTRQYKDGIVGVPQAAMALQDSALKLAAEELNRPVRPLQFGRKLTIVTGPPASGKSTVANEIAYRDDAAIVDSDEAKKMIPEFGNGEGANAVHEESKRLIEPVEQALMESGANMVIPKVGHSRASIDKMARKFKDAGYTVELVDLEVPVDVAMSRMLGRFGTTGRLIPPSYLLDEVGNNPAQVHREMAQEGEYDGYQQIDGSGTPEQVRAQIPTGPRPERGASGEPAGAQPRGPVKEEIARALDPYAPPRPEPMTPGQELRSVNPERVRAVALEVFDKIKTGGAGAKGRLTIAKEDGEITPQSLANAIAVAADNDGQNAGILLRNVAEYSFKPGVEKSDEEKRNMALAIINDASNVGMGKFVRKTDKFYDPGRREHVTVSTINMDRDLRGALGAEVEEASFTAPMSDPNDTSEIKRKPGNFLEGPALERAENTARHLQAQRYKLDLDYIRSMKADDLISAKSLAVVKNNGHLKFLRRRAQEKLDRLQQMADAWGDQELGFQYFIDKKGRLYPRGEFHHQSGDVIKAAFQIRNPDGTYTSLKNYNSVDHTGSGWQIEVAIARDDVAAPLVNIQPNSATGNVAKGDMYTAVRDALDSRIREIPGSEPFIKNVLDAEIENKTWKKKPGRNILKTPVIAVNYAGGASNFRTALIGTYYNEVKKGSLPDGFWHNAADAGYEAVGEIAPHATAWKDWAVDGLQKAIDAAERQGKDLIITVGPDGAYSVKRFSKETKEMIAQDNRAGSPIKKVEQKWKEDTDKVDVKKTARNMFSQVIQGYDAAIMHETVRNYIDATGGGHIVTNHDSYTVPPENAGILAASVRKAFEDVITQIDPGQKLREDIRAQTGVDIGDPPPPGSWDPASTRTASPVYVEENEVTGQQEERPPYTDLQGNPIEMAQGIDTGASPTSLEASFSRVEGQVIRTGRELKLQLDRAAQEAQNDPSVPDLSQLTPEAAKYLGQRIAEDARYAMADNANAIGWYDRKTRAALDIMSEVFPEIATDPDARFQFIWALAVTSNGIKVDKNFEYAAQAYEDIRENGRFTKTIEAGQAQKSINQGLQYYNEMVDRFGIDKTRDFMVSRFPASEIKQITGVEVTGENAATVVRGAAILGPKIGNGFFSNLYGYFDELTMDRWLMRTMGRHRGDLIESRPDMVAQKRGEIRNLIDGLSPEARKDLAGFVGQDNLSSDMSDAEVDAVGDEIKKRSAAPDWRENIAKYQGGEDFRKIGNALWKYNDGQKEQPGSGNERNFIREVFSIALAELQSNPDMSNLNMSDLQALVWYPEKRLYDAAKSKDSSERGYADDEAPDYENAARKYVDERTAAGGGASGSGSSPVQPGQSASLQSQGFDERGLREFRREAILDTAVRGGDPNAPAQTSGLVARKSLGDGARVRGLGPVLQKLSAPANRAFGKRLKSLGVPNPPLYEVPAASAPLFAEKIQASKDATRYGAAVYVYPTEEYAGMRLYLTQDGGAGFAVKPDGDIVSVFVREPKGSVDWLMQAAIDQGGRKLDVFDTVLPEIYARHNFKEVGRDSWNEDYKPDDWDKELFGPFNNGEPDIVHMEFDPSPRAAQGTELAQGVDYAGSGQGDVGAGAGRGTGGADAGGAGAEVAAGIDPNRTLTNPLGASVPNNLIQLDDSKDAQSLANFITSRLKNTNGNIGRAMHDVRASDMIGYKALSALANQLDGRPNGPTYKALARKQAQDLSALLDGTQIPYAGRNMTNSVRDEIRQHAAQRELAAGIDPQALDASSPPPLRGPELTGEQRATIGQTSGPATEAVDTAIQSGAFQRSPRAREQFIDDLRAAGTEEGLSRSQLTSMVGGNPAVADRMIAATGAEFAAAVDAPEGMTLFPETRGAFRQTIEAATKRYTHAEKPLQEVLSDISSIGAKAEQALVNRFAPVRTLEKTLNNGQLKMGAESAYKAAEMAVNDSGRQESLMFYGAAKLGKHGEFTVAEDTVGLRTIFDKAVEGVDPKKRGQAMADWMGWMAARRIKALKEKNPSLTFPMKDVEAALAKEQPQFQEAADMWRKHNNANLDFLVDTGRLKKAEADALKEDSFYVPLYRTDENVDGSPDLDLTKARQFKRGGGGELMSRDPGIKKLVGGDKKMIDNIMKNMIRNSQAMAASGMRNQAANQIFDMMQDAGLAKTQKISSKKPNKNAVRMWKNGKEKWVIPQGEGVEPLMVAMAGLSPLQLGAFQKILAGVGGVFRQGITLSPAFIVRNAFRGAVSAGVLTSGANITMRNNFFTGVKEAYRNSDATRAFKAQSGMGDFRFGNPDAGFGANDILIDYGLGNKTVGYRIRKAVDAMEEIGTATELADRVAAYNTMIENGVRPDEAAYRALNIINYGRKGASPELRAFLPMVPFLNARIQGLARFAEGATSADPEARRTAFKQLMLNGLVLAAASGAIWMSNVLDEEKDEKYKAEPLHRRLNYHIIYAGDKTILIPKAFEIGHAFSSIPELIGDAAFRDMGADLTPGLKKIVADTLLFNAIPQAFVPMIEGQANYSFFRERPIEGMRESSLKAADRTSDASALSRFIGRQLGVSSTSLPGAQSLLGAEGGKLSPSMIEHYLQGYGGAYYSALSSLVDIVATETGLIPPKPGGAFGATPVVSNAAERVLGSMFKDQSDYTTRYVSDFYEMKDYITQIYRSAKAASDAGNQEYMEKLLASAPATKRAYRIANKAQANLSKLNARIREVANNPSMSARQKQTQLRQLIPKRNAYAERVVLLLRELEERQGATFKDAA